jgi:hypothetical protein
LAARLTGFFAREPFLAARPGLTGCSSTAFGSAAFLTLAPAFPFFLELAGALELLSGAPALLTLLSAFAFFLVLAFGLTGFLARDEAEAVVRAVWSLLVCPTIGGTTIKAKSRPATPHASTEAETGKIATLMLPL